MQSFPRSFCLWTQNSLVWINCGNTYPRILPTLPSQARRSRVCGGAAGKSVATLENDLETTLLVAVGCCLLELDCLKSKLKPVLHQGVRVRRSCCSCTYSGRFNTHLWMKKAGRRILLPTDRHSYEVNTNVVCCKRGFSPSYTRTFAFAVCVVHTPTRAD